MSKKFKRVLSVIMAIVLVMGTLMIASAGGSSDSSGDPYDPNHQHVFKEFPVRATCTQRGYTIYVCPCGYGKVDNYTNALGHDFTFGVTRQPDCTTAGEKISTCSRCNALKSEAVAAKGHTAPVWTVATAATCTTDGQMLGLCEDCGLVIDTKTVPAKGHSSKYVVVEAEATADHKGIKTERCKECDAVLSSSEFDAHTHTLGYEKVLMAPTCLDDGEKGLFCSVCNACYDTEVIPATGHLDGDKTVSSGKRNNIEIVFLVDESVSMEDNDGAGIRKEVAKELTDRLGANDKGAVVGFQTTSRVVLGFTNDKNQIKNAIDQINDNGSWTHIYTGINTALDLFGAKTANTDRYIILITDGIGFDDYEYADEAAEKGVAIYTVGLSGNVDSNELQNIADTTGGKYYHANNAGELYGIFDTISEEITVGDLAWVNSVSPTCTAEGEKVGICSACGEIVAVETVEALGHQSGIWTVKKQATCSTAGEKICTCDACGLVVDSMEIPATGHHTSYLNVDFEPTADHKGQMSVRCTECETVLDTVEFDAHEHEFGYGKILIAPTCLKEGERGLFCAECGACYGTEVIPATGHCGDVSVGSSRNNIEIVFLIDESGSMTSSDYTEIRKEVANTLADKLDGDDKAAVVGFGHYTRIITNFTSDINTIKNAINSVGDDGNSTYMYDGLVKSLNLFSSDTTDAERYIILLTDGTAHDSLSYSALAAEKNVAVYTVGLGSYVDTYDLTSIATNTGGEYYHANNAEDLYEVFDDISDTIVNVGLTWISSVQPTCTTAGERIGICSDCGETVDFEEIESLGHDEGVWTVSLPATCTEAGEETKICTRCKSVIETREISALSHDEGVWTVTEKATCHEEGEQVKTCTRCGEVTESAKIASLGHDEGVWKVDYEATPDHNGQMSRYCSRCNAVLESKEIVLHVHSEGYREVITPAKCTVNGEGGIFCATCGVMYETYEIESLGHIYSEWHKNNNSTHTRTCSRCFDIETNNCQYTSTVTEPTCTEGGYTTHVCDICTFSYVDAYTDPLGHDWTDWAEDENGMTHSRECKRENCDAVETDYHNWTEWVYNEDGKLFCDGTKSRVCTDCGATETTKAEHTSWICQVFYPVIVFIGNIVHKIIYAFSLNWLFPWITIYPSI